VPTLRRTTVHLEADVHRALRRQAVETGRTVSALVREAVRLALAEDTDDLAAIEDRATEAFRPFESFLEKGPSRRRR
jgi:hypothetical protein